MSLTRRSFLRNLSALAGALGIGLNVTRPQQGFRKDYYKTFTIKGPDDSVLVGYKGAQFFETGAIYASYIPFYKTDMLVDARLSRQFAERYARVRLTHGKNLLQLS